MRKRGVDGHLMQVSVVMRIVVDAVSVNYADIWWKICDRDFTLDASF